MKLIKTVSYPSSFVINLDPSYKPGSHWVAVYFDRNGVGEYFDSFSHYNHMHVQKIYTTTCGQFVVFYIYQRSRGLMLEVILRKYFSTHNKLRTDLLLRDFVKLHYHHDGNGS